MGFWVAVGCPLTWRAPTWLNHFPQYRGSFMASLIIPVGKIPEMELMGPREGIFLRLLAPHSWHCSIKPSPVLICPGAPTDQLEALSFQSSLPFQTARKHVGMVPGGCHLRDLANLCSNPPSPPWSGLHQNYSFGLRAVWLKGYWLWSEFLVGPFPPKPQPLN